MAVPIPIPLINPNEPEALLAELHVREGQLLAAGDLICILETTKSTAEVHAESGGYVVCLAFEAGDTLQAGQTLAYLAESPDWQPAVQTGVEPRETEAAAAPEGLRITQPALVLAQKHDLDLSGFPAGILVTEGTVRALLETRDEPTRPLLAGDFDPTAILVYGCGGHGKAVLELLNALDSYRVVGFVDDGVPTGEIVMGLPVLGGKEALPRLAGEGVRLAANAVGGIGAVSIRQKVFHNLINAGFDFPAIAHPAAFIEPSATLSPGSQVFPLAYIGSEVRVGFGAIVNTGAIVSHECILQDLVNISPGAILAGGVTVGDRALIGMGVTVNLQVRVGAGARVGNGATVKADVPENGIVPAGTVWPRG